MNDELPKKETMSRVSTRECACGTHSLPIHVSHGYYVDNPEHAVCASCGETFRHVPAPESEEDELRPRARG